MRTLRHRVKDCLPGALRTRLRHLLAGMPLTRRLARMALCPWHVDFVIGGTMKRGTTALSAFLDQHPEIRMATGKEAHFFDNDAHFRPGQRPDYAAYHRHFTPGLNTRLLGDATPIYLYWESVPARVAAYNPRMKWVLLLRQPVERAYSHWNMLHQGGEEPLSFAEAVAHEPGRRKSLPGLYSYLDRGFYARQLRRLFAVVPRRQVLVLRSEELRRDHDTTLQRVFQFLGVDGGVRISPAVVHARPYVTPLPADLKRALTAGFADDLRDLERLLGWDLSDWLADGPLAT
jgi:Sulfotransferase domain